MPKVPNSNKKTRIRSARNKMWSEEEVFSMLFYISDRQNEGKQFEKPTHEMFYESLIQKLKWTNVKWQQVKAKMNNLRTKYVDVKNWMDQTGQGVDCGSIEAYKTKKCPFYDLLHSIFGKGANVSIPYLYDSLQTAQKTCNGEENSTDGVEVVGEMTVDQNGDLLASNMADIDLETLSIINVDSYFSAIEGDNVDSQEFLNQAATNNLADDDIELLESNENAPLESTVVEVSNSSSVTESRTDNTTKRTRLDDDIELLDSNENAPFENQSTVVDVSNSSSVTASRTNNATKRVTSTRAMDDDEMAFARFASTCFDTAREQREEHEDDCTEESGSRIARFKRQLSERSSSPHKRNIPSNAAAFVSDANLKRAETIQERNQIELRRVENEISMRKNQFDLDRQLQEEQMKLSKKEISFRSDELVLKEKELAAKFDFRAQNFELKCKKMLLKEKDKANEFKLKVMELEKNERLEKLKLEYDYKLQLELAKVKSQ